MAEYATLQWLAVIGKVLPRRLLFIAIIDVTGNCTRYLPGAEKLSDSSSLNHCVAVGTAALRLRAKTTWFRPPRRLMSLSCFLDRLPDSRLSNTGTAFVRKDLSSSYSWADAMWVACLRAPQVSAHSYVLRAEEMSSSCKTFHLDRPFQAGGHSSRVGCAAPQ
jgi:hypothetical protein